MRAVIQRVKEAAVKVDHEIVGSISNGLCVFVGFENEEEEKDLIWLSKKIVQMRIFSDMDQKMNLSLADIEGELLLVSQFTLHAKTKKGNRPSFILSAKPEIANHLYDYFGNLLEELLGREIQYGRFGAMMEVHIINDGPVTILIDTKQRE